MVFYPRQKFEVEVFLVIIDKLSLALQHRLDAYKDIHEKFGFLTNLTELSNDAIRWTIPTFMEEYSSDFKDCLPSESVQYLELLKKLLSSPRLKIKKRK